MSVITRDRVILGPCPCQGCREPLYWAKWPTRRLGNTVFQIAWREEDGEPHRCPNMAEGLARLVRMTWGIRWYVFWYTSGTGTSVTTDILMQDAVPLLVPVGTASVRPSRTRR